MSKFNKLCNTVLSEAKGITIYHGTNSLEGEFKLSFGKEGWFTDDYEYASSQGSNVFTFKANPKKVLDKTTVKQIKDKDIISALQKFKPNLSEDKILKVLPRIHKNIHDYSKGRLASNQIFGGMGDIRILQLLEFDMEKMLNPYDSSKKTYFYRVYNDSILSRIQE